jgi:hydroxymethylbilane synthase
VIRLGTRGSALALAQAQWVADRLPGEVEIVPIRTSGDQPSTKPSRGLTPLDKERFVKELDDALLAWDIDIAVHSAKDVPTSLARGLVTLGAPERGDPRDAICGADSIEALPEGAVVGTASLRRRALLLALRPDLRVRELRGNVDTRLQRLAEGDFDAIVLAKAGLDRLGRGDEGSPLDPSVFVPAAGQGHLMLTVRDAEPVVTLTWDTPLWAEGSHDTLHEERGLVRRLEAGCHTPVGAHAVATEDSIRLTAFVGLPDGSKWIRDELEMDLPHGSDLIHFHMAERMLAAGAAELLAEAERVATAG